MSYLNINPANQGEQSGKITVTFQSGGTLPVAIAAGLGSSVTFVNVLDPDTDARGVGNNSLNVLSYNYGYNQVNDQWARIYAVPSISGHGFFSQTATIGRPMSSGLTTRLHSVCTAASGGSQLGTSSAFKVVVRNLSGNNTVVVGGASGTNEEPASGVGYELYAGQEIFIMEYIL